MKMPKPKTIDNVTRADVITLAEAAVSLLACGRFQYWQEGGNEQEESENQDSSFRDALRQMERALELIGLPQGTFKEFAANVEDMLKSGLSPQEWKRRRAMPSTAQQHPGEPKQ